MPCATSSHLLCYSVLQRSASQVADTLLWIGLACALFAEPWKRHPRRAGRCRRSRHEHCMKNPNLLRSVCRVVLHLASFPARLRLRPGHIVHRFLRRHHRPKQRKIGNAENVANGICSGPCNIAWVCKMKNSGGLVTSRHQTHRR